jgi:hypothetical protein
MSNTTTVTNVAATRQAELDKYIAAKAELQSRWDKVSKLKGEEYTKAVNKYASDKKALKAQWEAFKTTFGG